MTGWLDKGDGRAGTTWSPVVRKVREGWNPALDVKWKFGFDECSS